jgi:hypothetical protein
LRGEGFEASTDAEAIASARERAGGGTIVCDEPLAAAAREAGLPVRPMTGVALELFANATLMVRLSPTLEEGCAFECPLLRFLEAGIEFMQRRAWDLPGVNGLFELRVRERGRPESISTLVVQRQNEKLDGPALGVVSREFALEVSGADDNLIRVDAPLQLLLVFVPAPKDLVELLLRAFKTDRVPIAMRGATPRLVGPAEIRLLTGVLECVNALASGRTDSRAKVGRISVEIRPHPHGTLLTRPPMGTA